MRLDIAERGEALAIIEATKLGDLYIEALRDGVVLPPAMARRAKLVYDARRAANPQEVVKSIVAVYGEARGSPLFPTIARASAIGLLNLPAQPQFANVAQEAMRGFLLLGDKQQTKAWTQLALTRRPQQCPRHECARPADAAGRHRRRRRSQAAAGRGRQSLVRGDAPGRCRRARRCAATCCSSCSAPPASTCRAAPPSCPKRRRPTPAWSRRPPPPCRPCQAAATGRRRAETALLASIAIGETPLIELHPAAVGAIVRALRQVGEDHAGAAVRDRDGDRPRAVSGREAQARPAAGPRGRGLHRNADGGARRLEEHRGRLSQRSSRPADLSGAPQAGAGDGRCRRRCAPT